MARQGQGNQAENIVGHGPPASEPKPRSSEWLAGKMTRGSLLLSAMIGSIERYEWEAMGGSAKVAGRLEKSLGDVRRPGCSPFIGVTKGR